MLTIKAKGTQKSRPGEQGLSMYIANIIPHGKCFVRCLHTRSISDTPQLVRKHRTRTLSMKYSICLLENTTQWSHSSKNMWFYQQLLLKIKILAVESYIMLQLMLG